MNKSKAMKALESKIAAAKVDAQALQTDDKATAEQINAKAAELRALQAKIEAQKVLDDGKEFDEAGEEIKDTAPVNKPIYAEPASHKGPFNSFGEQLIAVMNSSKPGVSVDKRLLELRNASGANESVPSEGGFLVQKDFADRKSVV